jgi:hypothetical protein
MTLERLYRKAVGYQSAREAIICSGTQFASQMVQYFLSIPEQIWFETKQNLSA